MSSPRTPFLFVLDVDSTLIQQEAIELLAAEAGNIDTVTAVTERAMRGELDFAESLRERVATLAGLSSSAFDRARSRISLTNGAQELVSAVHQRGGKIAVVSGGFHELLDPLAAELGLDAHEANRLEWASDALTGGLDGPIIDAQAKARAVRRWANQFDVPLSRTIAVGDGANDLAMMATAGLSVAFCAKAVVREKAQLVIDRPDLAQLAHLFAL